MTQCALRNSPECSASPEGVYYVRVRWLELQLSGMQHWVHISNTASGRCDLLREQARVLTMMQAHFFEIELMRDAVRC